MKLTHIFAVSVFGFSLSVGAAGADELGGRYVDILQTETKVASLLPQTNPVPGSSLSGEQDNAQRRGRHQRSAHAASAAPAELKQIVAEQAAANGVPFALAHAVVMVESRYNPRVSNGGALGLMQIKPATARGVGFSGPASGLYDPATNIRFGMRYLADAYRQAGGDICGTVMRYQSGLYTRSMSGANRAYCGKARQFMAQA
jgi:soluble lytic murein transglycosylase-like protein